MKIIRKLDEDDLKKIVAAHFYVDENDVSIYTSTERRGYGMQEHDVPSVVCQVTENDKELVIPRGSKYES